MTPACLGLNSARLVVLGWPVVVVEEDGSTAVSCVGFSACLRAHGL